MNHPNHLPTLSQINEWPRFTNEKPLKVLVSGCLFHQKTLVDGTSYDLEPIHSFLNRKNVLPIAFCPENYAIGTPRDMPDIHGGNGYDVLDRKATVLSDKNVDLTDKIVESAYEMLKIAKENEAHLALLVDMSAACGSQVISDGCRLVEDRKYQKGPGVCAALLIRNGFPVVSQRDYATLELIFNKTDLEYQPNIKAKDHHESEWYQEYFLL